MRRRDFIAALGGAAAYPLAARAQQSPVPVIGFVRSTPLSDAAHLVTAFREGLKEAGFIEGQNVAVEYRSADGQHDRLPAMTADLLRRPVTVIVANAGAAHVIKAATTTVPIVFATGTDPVRDRLVEMTLFNRNRCRLSCPLSEVKRPSFMSPRSSRPAIDTSSGRLGPA